MMKRSKLELAVEDMAGVRGRLAAWRAQRKRGERIPEELWAAAASVARRDGVGATSTALRLSYYDLRRRMEGEAAGRGGAPGPGPMFVEMERAPMPGPATATLEVARPDGTRVIVRLGALVESILRAGA
jgi:hypothetical protein